ncbi:hypothetical protein D0N36_19940 [Hymenobacter lapidiphilus]|uniref:hypothetical protein n=1 Tax=Hymenobacter sp. CCM 8763 TaxID=2303334 RepID=UPI000E342F05|nr:hypothetical protein [Hymenobacter sp. CCM 8763]RFP63340.1 hypothetical protein D0N36_19940 [Hymenobacter sp. CCM 8763]
MKSVNKFPALAALFLAFAFTGCEKASDMVAPQNPYATYTAHVVGDYWDQGGAVTGLSCPVRMYVVWQNLTGNGGNITKWEGVASCPPAETIHLNTEYTNAAGDTFQYSTECQPTGEVRMTTHYFPKKKKK